MDTQVIQNQKHLAVSSLDQSGHEPDQDLRCHILFVQHEPHLATVGNGRDHVNPALGGIDPNDRSFPLWGEPSGAISVVLDASFVTPVDLGLSLLGLGPDLRIDRLVPVFDDLRVLFIGPFSWSLWGKTPTFQVVGDGP